MKYLKTFEKLNNPKKYLLCLLNKEDRWNRNFYNKGEEPVYVIFKVLHMYSNINNDNLYDIELKILYEYQDEHNYSDRRMGKINNKEYYRFKNLNDKIVYQANTSKDVFDELSLIIQTNKFNL